MHKSLNKPLAAALRRAGLKASGYAWEAGKSLVDDVERSEGDLDMAAILVAVDITNYCCVDCYGPVAAAAWESVTDGVLVEAIAVAYFDDVREYA